MVELTQAQKAERANLVQLRGQIKARVTRCGNYLLKSGVYADAEVVDRHVSKIDTEIIKLPAIAQELIALEPEGNHEEETENIMSDYEDMMVLVRKFREPNREAIIANQVAPVVGSCSGALRSNTTDYLSSIPKVEVKKFDGKLENFRPYRDWFRKFIHERQGLSDFHRLDMLKRTLTGEPEKMISAFKTTDENYAVAWELFEKTYNVEYVLIFRHCDLLHETPSMKNSSPEEIRKLVNHIQTQILAMKALGETVENWNTLISHIIMRRMDKDTEREWCRSKQGNKIPNYEDLLAFLREQAIHLTSTSISKGSQNSTISSSHNKSKKVNNGNRVQSLLTGADAKNCPKCKEQHPLEKCGKFLALSIPDRIQAAREEHLCLNCFRGNHKTRFCKAARCSTCQKRHNTLLHLLENDLKVFQGSSA